ncbi:hypothetical protein [Halarcobacter sp.]|uniref:hypothetical protein n=1 Tax=Halarcobacter sp. TaxID=2321133 RepID=UPI0029F57003|nr:hypothetical protein [Halarcobacter sp.]
MKLYIKANNLKILKNLDDLLPSSLSKASLLIDANSLIEYQTNLNCANEILKYQEELFFDKRDIKNIIKGIYFGNSSCEHLIPSFTDILEAKKICDSRHYNFVFSLPPISEFKLNDIKEVFELLNQSYTEVVVNDFGTLQLASEYKNLKPVLGLTFSKVIKSAFIDSIKPSDLTNEQLVSQSELLSQSEFECSQTREFYKSLGVGRFSIENINLNLEFLQEKPKLQVDFYYPNITIANSKACDIAGLFEDKNRYFVQEQCNKYCNQISLEFEHSKVLGLYQRFNSIYKINTNINVKENLSKDIKNRFIWEIFI